MEAVTHHGRTTAYRVAARDDAGGAPVLCVHGSGGTSGLWAGQRPLSAERPVVAVDLSGHGESEDVAADPGYETLSAHVDDVVAVARATDARVLVGNSLGGAVALTLALERTHAVEGLVLTGTAARLSVLADLLAWRAGEFERAVEFLHEPDHLFHDADERVLERSRAAMRETGPAVTRRDFRTCHTFDVRGRLDAVDVPAVAVVGEHDRLTPRRRHEYLARELSTCELAVVEDAAHLAMLESPTAFNAVLSEFCARFVD